MNKEKFGTPDKKYGDSLLKECVAHYMSRDDEGADLRMSVALAGLKKTDEHLHEIFKHFVQIDQIEIRLENAKLDPAQIGDHQEYLNLNNELSRLKHKIFEVPQSKKTFEKIRRIRNDLLDKMQKK